MREKQCEDGIENYLTSQQLPKLTLNKSFSNMIKHGIVVLPLNVYATRHSLNSCQKKVT